MKIIKPIKKLCGTMTLPGDKSISHRAMMLGAIARGTTRAKGVLDCDDCNYTIGAFRAMGVSIEKEEDITLIAGKGLKGLSAPASPIDVGNSGTSARLLSGILAGQDFGVTLTGSKELSERPMKRIVEPLSLMGADIKAQDGEYLPLKIRPGKLAPIDYKMPVPSAQVKSAILLTGLYAPGVTSVEEKFKSRDHTERMLKFFGAKIMTGGMKVSVEGGKELEAKDLEVPGDISSAAFFLVGATLLKGSKIKINKLGMNPTRAGILNVLSRMGARIKVLDKRDLYEPVADIEVESSVTSGVEIKESEIPAMIDELPAVFVLAALSKGRTVIRGAKELRVKETDRIRSMKENLEKMGAKFRLEGEDIIIEGVSSLKGARLKSFNDHRTCMSLAIAALAADGESEIDDTGCISKSFPGFFETLERSYA